MDGARTSVHVVLRMGPCLLLSAARGEQAYFVHNAESRSATRVMSWLESVDN